jgi:oligoendopeptidase F
LSAGGSDYPYNLFKKAGIDFATPAVHRALEARMNAIMDDMEKLLAQK